MVINKKLMSFDNIAVLKNNSYLMEINNRTVELPYTFIGARCNIQDKIYYHDCSKKEFTYQR